MRKWADRPAYRIMAKPFAMLDTISDRHPELIGSNRPTGSGR